jgi:hypothetical protein
VVTGLANGQTYRFRVAAETAYGIGPPSVATNPVTIGAPDAPTAVAAFAMHGKAAVHWSAPGTNGSRITGYVVTPYRNGVAQRVRLFTSRGTTETMSGLTAGKTYTFSVAAINGRGTGPSSSPSAAVIG